MIAVDTNILVYAHRGESPFNEAAVAALARLAEASGTWALPWQCVVEFFGIVTHKKLYRPPSRTEQALEQLSDWLSSPSLVLIGEVPGFFSTLSTVLLEAEVTGPQVHDARIAAVCLAHGVSELWSADGDFSRFPRLKVRNPLVG